MIVAFLNSPGVVSETPVFKVSQDFVVLGSTYNRPGRTQVRATVTEFFSFVLLQIVDPWGSVIAQCREGNDVCVAEIDLSYMDKVRQQMPCMNHKRSDLYGNLKSCPKL